MNLETRIEAFSELGSILRDSLEGRETRYRDRILTAIENQERINPWFTPSNVRMALKAVADRLTPDNMKKWTGEYPALNENYNPVTIAIIMAGNIPLAGFHDFLAALISGNRLTAKTSSKDPELILIISDILSSVNSGFKNMISFTDGKLTGFDAVIATGSNNSARYFEYYFGRYPHIIRKNRNSVAVLEGDESDSDIENLGTDIFSYYGLGCRNVSKIFIPEGYDLKKLSTNWEKFSGIINHNKYANNYEYNMTVFMVNREKYTDTGYLLLREDKGLSSPVAVLYYEYYKTTEGYRHILNNSREKIQCIAGNGYAPFGTTQQPELWDYADDTDTLDFLLKINMPGIL